MIESAFLVRYLSAVYTSLTLIYYPRNLFKGFQVAELQSNVKKIWVLFFKANSRLNQVGSQRKHKTAACLVLHIRNCVYSQEQTLHHWSFLCRDQQVVMKTLSKKKEQTQSSMTLLNC